MCTRQSHRKYDPSSTAGEQECVVQETMYQEKRVAIATILEGESWRVYVMVDLIPVWGSFGTFKTHYEAMLAGLAAYHVLFEGGQDAG